MEQKKKNTIIGIGDRNSRKFKKEREGFRKGNNNKGKGHINAMRGK